MHPYICIALDCLIVILIATTPLSPFTSPWPFFAAASVGGKTKCKQKHVWGGVGVSSYFQYFKKYDAELFSVGPERVSRNQE